VKYKWKLFESADMRRDNIVNLPLPVQWFVQDIRDEKQIRWRGDFNPQDPVHVDSPLNKNNLELWKQYHNDCHDDYNGAQYKWRAWFQSLFGNKILG